MDHETVTISEDNTTMWEIDNKREILAKSLNCTCGWKRVCQIPRAQGMASSHLKFEHGGGRIVYAGSEEIV